MSGCRKNEAPGGMTIEDFVLCLLPATQSLLKLLPLLTRSYRRNRLLGAIQESLAEGSMERLDFLYRNRAVCSCYSLYTEGCGRNSKHATWRMGNCFALDSRLRYVQRCHDQSYLCWRSGDTDGNLDCGIRL